MNIDEVDFKNLKVVHPFLGEGVVKASKWAGMHLYVEFRTGAKMWLNRKVLRFIDPLLLKETPQKHKASKKLKLSPVKGDYKSRCMVEAFRLGIVPQIGIEEFTIARQKELSSLFNFLKDEKNNVLLIEGDYGSGKTHLINYIYWWALKNGYGVCKVELDLFDAACYRPKGMYREIIKNLRFILDGKEETLRGIMYKAMEKNLLQNHIFFNKLIHFMKENNDNRIIWDWISGEELPRDYLNYIKLYKLPVLLNHSPAVDLYIYLLTGISYALKQLGAKALLIIIDEVETLGHLSYRRINSIANYFYKGLIKAANNEKYLSQLNLSKTKNEQSILYEGGKLDKWGLLHSGVRPTPYAYSIPTYMKVILAITNATANYFAQIKELIKNVLPLTPYSKQDYKLIYNKLIQIYQRAFPHYQIDDNKKEKLFNNLLFATEGNIRFFIKATVEVLDYWRHRDN